MKWPDMHQIAEISRKQYEVAAGLLASSKKKGKEAADEKKVGNHQT